MKVYKILHEKDADRVLKYLKAQTWNVGKARTNHLTGTIKKNKEILYSRDEKTKQLLNYIGLAIFKHPEVQKHHLPNNIRIPKFNKYSLGDEYKIHTDAPWMGPTRTDLSCTLFLSDPEQYKGGELCVQGKKPVKAKAGECVIYDCGEKHWVRPVTEGERICAVTWIQSKIRDSKKRQMVSSFRDLLAKMEKSHPDWFLQGGGIHSSLLRMWMD